MLDEQISKDYVQAMKDRDKVRSSTLSFLRAQMKNIFIEKKAGNAGLQSLPDADVIAVIKKQIKQRQDSITQYENGGRQDLASKESSEMAILKEYLPVEMSEQELEALVADAIAETQANSMKDMGKVMKVITAKAQGKADNKLVSDIVKRALSQK